MYGTFNFEMDKASVDEFLRALEAYSDTRRDKGFHYCLNRSAKDVAFWAAHFTLRADRGKVEAMLREPAGVRTVSRSGRPLRHPKQMFNNSRGARILAMRMSRAGKNPKALGISSAEFDGMVKRFIAQTLRSINFMRSGWLPAAKKLAALVHESSGLSMGTAFGRSNPNIPTKFPYPQIGEAIPAQEFAGMLAVEIANQSVNPRNKTSWSKGIGKWGPPALAQALSTKAADMMVYVEAEAKKRAKRLRLS